MDMREQIAKASEVIEEGAVVIYPTETAYGIAADATNRKAVEKVYDLKKRPKSKGLTTIVSSLGQAERYGEIGEEERKIIEEFMPGPLTLIVDKNDNLPDNLNDKFVFRISSSRTARKLAENTPITATSANISGQDTSYSIEEIDPKLREEADYILDAGKLEKSPTSTIVELQDGEIVVHREGPIKKEQIQKVLQL